VLPLVIRVLDWTPVLAANGAGFFTGFSILSFAFSTSFSTFGDYVVMTKLG